MIDTDKYEGHLIHKAVEVNSQVWSWSDWLLKNAENTAQMRATAELLNDAPLLLAEVKRLREAIADIATNMEAADGEYMAGFIEDLWEVIE